MTKLISIIILASAFNLKASEIFCSPDPSDTNTMSEGHLILKINEDKSVSGKHINLSNHKVSLLNFKKSECVINEAISIRCLIRARNNHGTSTMSSLDISLTNSNGRIHSYVPLAVHKINCVELKID